MSDPQSVIRFETLLQPYTTERVQLPFYGLVSRKSDNPEVHVIDFQLFGETAIAFHFDLAQSTFRVADVGPLQVTDFDALAAVFDRAKAFIVAAREGGFEEGEVRR